MNTRANELFDLYNSFKVDSVTTRRFKQSDMLGWLAPLVANKTIQAESLGRSGEGRTIPLYRYGTGARSVLMWSQMHGDESTATMALLDLFNFLSKFPNHETATLLRERITLHTIPMLNPDGAERFTRRTAQLIDMNRDALDLQTPEAQILKTTRDRLDPEFGFNLHDQDPRYSVGTTKQITAIALLAPAFDHERTDNAVRLRAKRVAAVFAETMNQFIPNNLARWDDTFEPRAFGDNIQKWGTSTVLVESGGWKNDREKMFLRKLNCVGLLTALASIADGSFEKADVQAYERIPFNTKLAFDLVLRNAKLKAAPNAPAVRVDVGINFDEVADERGTVTLSGRVMDVGDLSTFTAFEEQEVGGKLLNPATVGIERPFTDVKSLFLT